MYLPFKTLRAAYAVMMPGSEADALCHCLQNFLSVNGIKFYESKMNLNWKPIIKSIQEVWCPQAPHPVDEPQAQCAPVLDS